jgi:lysine 2,3-aminomutase
MSLYALKVKPYYFFHAMPETLGAEQFRTTVRHGAELVSRLKRRISNAAMPEYVILHSTGKHMVPLEPQGTENFQYLSGGRIRFKNWKGEWCEYLDGSDA